MRNDISSAGYIPEGEAGELFLDECLDLYEGLEDALMCVDTMIGDIEIAAEEIRETFDAIEKRMSSCEERLKVLVQAEYRRTSGLQENGIPKPEKRGGVRSRNICGQSFPKTAPRRQ